MQDDRHELTSDEARKLYAAARKFATIAWDILVPSDAKSQPERREDPNQRISYPQTANGFFLEFYYGLPHKLWTPWGAWKFGSLSLWRGEAQVEELMSHLTTTLAIAHRSDDLGEHGPVYALHAIDGEELPEPKRRTPQQEHDKAPDLTDEWDRLTTEWCGANGDAPPATPGEK